jgi:hypothetical protein
MISTVALIIYFAGIALLLREAFRGCTRSHWL